MDFGGLGTLSISEPQGVAVVAAVVGVAIYYTFVDALYHSTKGFALSALFGVILGLTGPALSQKFGWTFPGWDWVAVAFLGGGVAVGELVSRYQDAPTRTLRTTPAFMYVLLNAGASVAALMVIEALGWQVQPGGATLGSDTVHWPQVLTAGLGAMALLRSALFTVRVGSEDVAVGPSTFLQAIIDATDSALDRLRAEDRARAATRLTERVLYEKALVELPAYCLSLLQNFPKERKDEFLERIQSLSDGDEAVSTRSKLLMLALYSMNYFGERVVQSAIASLGSEIMVATQSAATNTNVAQRAVSAARTAVHTASDRARSVSENLGRSPQAPENLKVEAAESARKVAEAEAATTEAEEMISKASESAEHAARVVAGATAVAGPQLAPTLLTKRIMPSARRRRLRRTVANPVAEGGEHGPTPEPGAA